MDKTTLGDRQKAYEKAYDIKIIKRLPVIVKADGKNFSKYTKKNNFKKPFDDVFSDAMSNAMKDTASNIEGCIFSYTQSDEITFILRNDQSLISSPWFDNRIQKICSIVSSIISVAFNDYINNSSRAYFDTRVFAVPTIYEAENYIHWRQNDCVKNSISAACYYEVAKIKGKKTARGLMHKLNQKQQQELLFQETGINWNDYPVKFKRGVGAFREAHEVEVDGNKCIRSPWVIDNNIPRFTQNRQYLEDILLFDHDKE